jgi:beta-lactamase regulating signal transducer with metallopeptidase domain
LQKNAANRGNVPLGHAAISQAQAEVAKAALTLWVVGVLTARKYFHSLVELLYQLRNPVGDFLAQQQTAAQVTDDLLAVWTYSQNDFAIRTDFEEWSRQ